MSVIAQNRLQTLIKNHIKAGILKTTHDLFTFHDHNLRADALSRGKQWLLGILIGS